MDSLVHSRELAIDETTMLTPKVLAFFFSLVMSFITDLTAMMRDGRVGGMLARMHACIVSRDTMN